MVDLFLAYRAAKGFAGMVALFEKLPPPLAETVMVQGPFAFALKTGKTTQTCRESAPDLLDKRGPSSETYRLLGRADKDRWNDAPTAGGYLQARGFLRKAIDAYLKGFETDWRDAISGHQRGDAHGDRGSTDPRRKVLVPRVSYAVKRRIEAGQPDYRDYATRLELAVIAKVRLEASDTLPHALANVREPWEPETTARTLRLTREQREKRDEEVPWALEIERGLYAP